MFVGVGIGIAFGIEIAIGDISILKRIATPIPIPGFCDINSIFGGAFHAPAPHSNA